ncbi:MAG: hypothetical protein ABGW97_14100 [Christiangramia sp.]
MKMQSANPNQSAVSLRKKPRSRRSYSSTLTMERDFQKGRLTEADLEEFQKSIIEFNKKRQYRTLAVFAMIVLSMGVAWYLFLY